MSRERRSLVAQLHDMQIRNRELETRVASLESETARLNNAVLGYFQRNAEEGEMLLGSTAVDRLLAVEETSSRAAFVPDRDLSRSSTPRRRASRSRDGRTRSWYVEDRGHGGRRREYESPAPYNRPIAEPMSRHVHRRTLTDGNANPSSPATRRGQPRSHSSRPGRYSVVIEQSNPSSSVARRADVRHRRRPSNESRRNVRPRTTIFDEGHGWLDGEADPSSELGAVARGWQYGTGANCQAIAPRAPPSHSGGTPRQKSPIIGPMLLDDSNGDGTNGGRGNDDTAGALDHGGDDDSEDDDVPLHLLLTSEYRKKISAPHLVDAAGTDLTTERLGVLWGVCGCVPLDDLPGHYQEKYSVAIAAAGKWPKVRLSLRTLEKFLPFETRARGNGSGVCELLLRDGSHIKNFNMTQRLFVEQKVPEAILFFYLVTTVLRPLEYDQGDTVVQLWTNARRKSPLDIRVVDAMGHGEAKRWAGASELWRDAVHWLRDLVVHTALVHGFEYVLRKVDGWSNSTGRFQDERVTTVKDPDGKKVYGLGRSDLVGLFGAVATLLSSILSVDEMTWLEDQLAQPWR